MTETLRVVRPNLLGRTVMGAIRHRTKNSPTVSTGCTSSPIYALAYSYRARRLNEQGICCVVVAPSLVPTQKNRRIKTDRRDAVRLAHFLRSGDLVEVSVPEAQTEAMRDLERAREDAIQVERVARHNWTSFFCVTAVAGRRPKVRLQWHRAHAPKWQCLPSGIQAIAGGHRNLDSERCLNVRTGKAAR